MGRDRLRRGYSLEVIFEEDSDFCSQLDSLDAVPFGYSTDRNNNSTTTKYLLHSHQRDFSVIELFGVSGRGSCDNWDSPNDDDDDDESDDTSSQPNNPNVSNPHPPITHLATKPDTTSLDQLLNLKGRNMETCYIEWDDEFSLNSLNKSKLKFQDSLSQRQKDMTEIRDMRELSPSSDSHSTSSNSNSSGRRSRVSRRQIVEANWIVNENEDEDGINLQYASLNSNTTNMSLNMNMHFNPKFPNTLKSIKKTPTGYSPLDAYEYYRTDPRILIIDTPSQNKTLMTTDMTFINTTSYTKLPNSRASVTMTFKSDEDSPIQLTSTFSSLSKIEDGDYNHLSSESRSTSASSSSTDVKRVRAIFESGKTHSSSEDETTSNPNPMLRFNKQNHHQPNHIKSKLEKKISAGSNHNARNYHPSIPSRGSPTSLRSTYSPISLGQMERYDLVDLLVNDNIIIEDNPDLFQTLRHERNRREKEWGSRNNLFTQGKDSPSPKFTLRRSKSVGTGIHTLEMEMSQSEIESELSKSRPSIIAEELPARNTVRNVRSLFEQILQQKNEILPNAIESRVSTSSGNSNGKDEENIIIERKFIFNNKALSSIKSNPTSKIFRSESIKDEMDGGRGRYGTSILLKVNSQKSQEELSFSSNQKLTEIKEKGHFGLKERPKEKPPLDDETLSLTSSGTADESEEPKLISPDILHRIRSLGTTTTYFGGEILSKTIRNQKCAVTKRNVDEDEEDNDEVDGRNYNTKSPPQQLQMDEFYFSVKSGRGGGGGASSTERQPPLHLPLDSFYKTRRGHVNTAPRIISVLPKSPSTSPTKSNSPVGSFLEGRNSPEGCESNSHHQPNKAEEGWINTDDSTHDTSPPLSSPDASPSERMETGHATNPNATSHQVNSKKFSEAAEGVWF